MMNNYNRKSFLKMAATAAAGFAFASCTGAKASAKGAGSIKNLGIQLYTLRDDFPKNPKACLKQLASFGYKEIESYEGDAGMFWGMGNKQFSQCINELGMKLVSSHCNFTKDFEKKAEAAGEIGMHYVICPWVGPQKTIEDYKKIAGDFNTAGEICRKNGLRFAYHNHEYSFKMQEEQYPQDIMMQYTDAALVDFEMDMYWVVAAQQDPASWLKKYKNRFRLCHIKDRKKGVAPDDNTTNYSCIIGNGSIDFATLLRQAEQYGMQHYIVEQEAYEKAPMDCVKESAVYMQHLKF